MGAHHFSNILTMSEYTSFRVSSVGFTTPARNSFSSKAIFLSTFPLRRTTQWFIFFVVAAAVMLALIHSVFIRNKKQRTRRMNRYTLTQYLHLLYRLRHLYTACSSATACSTAFNRLHFEFKNAYATHVQRQPLCFTPSLRGIYLSKKHER